MSSHIGEREENIFSAGIWTVKPGREEEFHRRFTDFANWTAEHQKGVMSVVLVRDIDLGNVFISFGPWADLESIREWRRTPGFSDAFRDFRELCEKIEPHTLRRVWSLAVKSG